MDEINNIISSKPKEGEPWDVIIIGSGPAGLTAAIYTTRGSASTLVIGGEKWGGQLMLTTTVDNYPGLPGIQGPELMQRMRDHSTKFGAEFLEKNVESVDFTKTPLEVTAGGEKYQAKSVIIATGAETRWLGVPGEEKLRGRGVSSCAPCDAPFFKDKKVAVIGGGDSAMEEALVLTKYASSVTIIHRRDAFKASAAMEQKIMKQVKAGKVNVMWNSEVEEFLGDQKLEKLKIKNSKTNETTEVAFDGAFVAIGHTINGYL
jgi:thioredoxin reductase (NADPH)